MSKEDKAWHEKIAISIAYLRIYFEILCDNELPINYIYRQDNSLRRFILKILLQISGPDFHSVCCVVDAVYINTLWYE